MKLSAEQRLNAISLAARSAVTSGVVTLRANGKAQALASSDTDALLAKAVARERVELELELLAYEQGARDADGQVIKNRNRVRLRDGLMVRLGRTGKGNPFLRDHRQGDSLARGGTVLESRTEKLADGHYQILQSVRLSEPSAVERALRGLMSGVSVSWSSLGPVVCTGCGTEVLTECFHFPGDRTDDGDEVEWEYTDAELLETSEVPVASVQSASIEGIRAALSAAINRGASPQESHDMSKFAMTATLLGLAATASEDEITEAVKALATERTAFKQQLEASQRSIAETNARLATHEAALAKQAEDVFIADGIKAGKMTLGAHVDAMRAYFRSSPDGARAMLAAAPVITAVGQPPQLSLVPPPSNAPGAADARTVLAAQGVDHDKARRFAKAFGAPDPDKALELYARRGWEA